MTSVKLSDDETIVQDFHAANIKKPSKGEAHVILTDKRVIIDYRTSKSVLTSDINIADVRGADVSWTKESKDMIKGITLLIIGLVITVGSVSAGSMGYSGLAIGIPLLALGGFLIYRKKTIFVIIIYTHAMSATLSIHNIPAGLLSKGTNQAQLTLDGTPGPDAERMADELGMLIRDIQNTK